MYRLCGKLQSFLLSLSLSFETIHLFLHCVALESFFKYAHFRFNNSFQKLPAYVSRVHCAIKFGAVCT
jgi:hypothetical protein